MPDDISWTSILDELEEGAIIDVHCGGSDIHPNDDEIPKHVKDLIDRAFHFSSTDEETYRLLITSFDGQGHIRTIDNQGDERILQFFEDADADPDEDPVHGALIGGPEAPVHFLEDIKIVSSGAYRRDPEDIYKEIKDIPEGTQVDADIRVPVFDDDDHPALRELDNETIETYQGEVTHNREIGSVPKNGIHELIFEPDDLVVDEVSIQAQVMHDEWYEAKAVILYNPEASNKGDSDVYKVYGVRESNPV